MDMTTKGKNAAKKAYEKAAAAAAAAAKRRLWVRTVRDIVDQIRRNSDVITATYVKTEKNGMHVKFFEGEKCFYEMLVLDLTSYPWILTVANGYEWKADDIWNLFHKLASERGL